MSKPIVVTVPCPFHLMGVMLEGFHSRELQKTKQKMMENSSRFNRGLDRLTKDLTDYCILHIEAGADAILLREPSAGYLSRDEYKQTVHPRITALLTRLSKVDVTTIYYATRSAPFFDLHATSGADVIYPDHTISLRQALDWAPEPISVMGDIDPNILLSDEDVMDSRIDEGIEHGREFPFHIFSTGAPLLQNTDLSAVRHMVKRIHTV
ncbi:MAG: uroporphyrinogen decarboxylase family protein [bacterium]